MNTIIVENNQINIPSIQGLTAKESSLTINKNQKLFLEYHGNNDIIINITPNIDVGLFIFSKELDLNTKITINLTQNSKLNVTKFYNNKKTEDQTIINLLGENAQITYHYSSICTSREKSHIIINHLAQNTISNIINKAITISKSSCNFIIDSYLPPNTPNCLLNQDTKIITLGDNYSSIEPNMYIEDHDVKATHGSVIGKFNKEDIFYLQSRGLDYNTSINLLARGFLIGTINLDVKQLEKILKEVNKYWR